MKNSLETLSLLEFMFQSKNETDFCVRVGQMCGVISLEFHLRVQDEVKFDFHLVKIVDEINADVNTLVESLNRIKIVEEQPKLPKYLFIEIIKTHFKDFHDKYQYYKKIINN
jgi:predicted transglutaminase-like cysteine proteinase